MDLILHLKEKIKENNENYNYEEVLKPIEDFENDIKRRLD